MATNAWHKGCSQRRGWSGPNMASQLGDCVEKILYGLLVLVPVAIVLAVIGAPEPAVFVASGLALAPLAALLGRATEAAATYTGPAIGALLNATFGNAAELIITFVALREGLIGIVKASIAGSIIGNILIVVGASALAGGLRHGTQQFDARSASASASLLALAVVSLVIPAVFGFGVPDHQIVRQDLERLSIGVALALILAYVLYLIYTLRQPPGQLGIAAPTPTGTELPAERAPVATSDNARSGVEPGPAAHADAPTMRLPLAVVLMAGSTIAVVAMSEILIGAVEPTAAAWGLTELFVGVILVPLIGNVAEHVVAVQAAWKNQMDLSLGIALGSALQIVLFVAPALVLVSHLVGHPMTLVFNVFELTALLAGTFIAVLVANNGESTWLEGAELILLYFIIAIAFFFVP
jgi:Ca2+:H+ antiporter